MQETCKPKLTIRKGDTEPITLVFSGEDAPDETVEVLFTVKKSINSPDAMIEKKVPITDGRCVIELSAEETDIQHGYYLWDIRFRYPDGSIFTPMGPARFEVVGTVGDTEGFDRCVSIDDSVADGDGTTDNVTDGTTDGETDGTDGSDAGQGGEAGG